LAAALILPLICLPGCEEKADRDTQRSQEILARYFERKFNTEIVDPDSLKMAVGEFDPEKACLAKLLEEGGSISSHCKNGELNGVEGVNGSSEIPPYTFGVVARLRAWLR